ncbi:hypothetical protein [Agrococcus sp. HG114]|uniref:hypothetical protein n=1 Tax=Agrococcus sp. HG114 TaxID=2969757 RepID=UPI00215A6D46|nr:hypothetical protein [Agrococcus sp. HG114]MCR8669905.1 hypothetical protein [Agrococcus sp. HG114]
MSALLDAEIAMAAVVLVAFIALVIVAVALLRRAIISRTPELRERPQSPRGRGTATTDT